MMISARDGGQATVTVVGADGDQVALDALPAVVVKDPTGAALSPALTVVADPIAPGRYLANIPAGHPALTSLGLLTIVWTGALAGQPWTVTDTLEVIDAWPFTLADMRAANTDLADCDRRPAEVLAMARLVACARVEAITRVSWMTRRVTETVPAPAGLTLRLQHPEVQQLHALSVAGASVPPSEVDVAAASGVLTRGGGWGSDTVTIDYSHGRTPPPELAAAIRDLAVFSAATWGARVPERATAVSTDVGMFRLSMPGRDGPTGLPEIDAVLAPYTPPAVG